MRVYSRPVSPHVAFDQIADGYDAAFTQTPIGRAQRSAVWRIAKQVFRPGDHVLELNCGTGEDALYLASLGVEVVAYDVSEQMIAVARRRKANEAPELPITFAVGPIEHIRLLAALDSFDGVFSNFSGLNCVEDLRGVAEDLALLTRADANLLICMSSRICLWEMAWYASHLQFRVALRRLAGQNDAKLEGNSVRIWYPTVGQLRRIFAPRFTIRSITAIGLCVPPSYTAGWIDRHPRILELAERADGMLSNVPFIRVAGDHVLLHLQRSAA